MKIAAHPMVVAVAMGLLSPSALAETEDERCAPRREAPCVGCDCGRTDADASLADPTAARHALDDALAGMLR